VQGAVELVVVTPPALDAIDRRIHAHNEEVQHPHLLVGCPQLAEEGGEAFIAWCLASR
jgi:hypothetical protein